MGRRVLDHRPGHLLGRAASPRRSRRTLRRGHRRPRHPRADRRARAHRVRAQRRELLDPQPHRAGHPGRHDRPHVPRSSTPPRCGPRTMHEINVIGTMNLFAAASAPGSTVRDVVVKSSTLRLRHGHAGPGRGSPRRRQRTNPARNRIERSLESVEGYVRDFAEDNPHVERQHAAVLQRARPRHRHADQPGARAAARAVDLRLRPPLPVRARGGRRPVDPVRARPPPARHLQRGRRRPAALERGRGHLRQAHRADAPDRAPGWPPGRCASIGVPTAAASCSTCCATAAASTTGGSRRRASTTATRPPGP